MWFVGKYFFIYPGSYIYWDTLYVLFVLYIFEKKVHVKIRLKGGGGSRQFIPAKVENLGSSPKFFLYSSKNSTNLLILLYAFFLHTITHFTVKRRRNDSFKSDHKKEKIQPCNLDKRYI
jgi:hypothetical protein